MTNTKSFLSTTTYIFLVSIFSLALFFVTGSLTAFLFSLVAEIFSYKNSITSLPSIFLVYVLGSLVFFLSLACIFTSDKIAEFYNRKWIREYGQSWLLFVSLVTLVLLLVIFYLGVSTLQVNLLQRYWS